MRSSACCLHAARRLAAIGRPAGAMPMAGARCVPCRVLVLVLVVHTASRCGGRRRLCTRAAAWPRRHSVLVAHLRELIVVRDRESGRADRDAGKAALRQCLQHATCAAEEAQLSLGDC